MRSNAKPTVTKSRILLWYRNRALCASDTRSLAFLNGERKSVMRNLNSVLPQMSQGNRGHNATRRGVGPWCWRVVAGFILFGGWMIYRRGRNRMPSISPPPKMVPRTATVPLVKIPPPRPSGLRRSHRQCLDLIDLACP